MNKNTEKGVETKRKQGAGNAASGADFATVGKMVITDYDEVMAREKGTGAAATGAGAVGSAGAPGAKYRGVYARKREAEMMARRDDEERIERRIEDGAAAWKRKVDGIKRHVRTLLKGRGVWASEMGYQVELLAVDLLIYRRLAEACASVPVLEFTYGRDDKERRTRVNPLFADLARQADVVRRDLKSLMMNKELRPASRQDETGRDELAEFIKAVGGDDE